MADAWLPIADAPRNGTSLLLSDRDGVFIGHWHGGQALGFWTDGTEVDGRNVHRLPTVWMPLPVPNDPML